MHNKDLTAREVEILSYLQKGMQYKEIAAHAYISLNTVKKHLKNIYRKKGYTKKRMIVDAYTNETLQRARA